MLHELCHHCSSSGCSAARHAGCRGPFSLPHPMFWEGCPSTDAMGQDPSKPQQWWGLVHGSTGGVSLTLSKQGDLQLFLKSCVCLSPFWGFWTGLIPQAANPAAHWVVLQSWALHSSVPSF